MKKDKLIIIIGFLASLSLFLYQHSSRLSWDFMAYVLNSEFLFYNGYYFELYRAPLTPIIIGIFHLLGRFFAEYLYILFASLLFLFSSIKLAKKLNINPSLYYCIALTPFLITRGLLEGTELLSISLIQIAIATLDEKKSSIFMALAALNHYSNIIYAPVMLFKKDYKKIIISCIIFLAILSPWLLYNQITTGNPFTSFADSYALNVKFRDYIHEPFNWLNLLGISGYYLPFIAYGIFLRLKGKLEKVDIIMLWILFITLYYYSTLPMKSSRYLIMLLIPITYLTHLSISGFKNKKKIISIFLAINLIISSLIIILTPVPEHEKKETYKSIPISKDCSIFSNTWVHLNYMGIKSQSAPWEQLLDEEVNNGSRIILFKNIRDPKYSEEKLSKLPRIIENNELIILGNESLCNPHPEKINSTYIEKLKRVYRVEYNETFNVKIFGMEY